MQVILIVIDKLYSITYYVSKYVYKPLLYRFSEKEKIQDVLDLCNMIVNYNGIKIKTNDVIIYDTRDSVFGLYDSVCRREKKRHLSVYTNA